MEDTYRIKAIILNRKPFREHDLKVTVYSAEKGKQSLVARGAKKFKSKLAAHLEPLCFSEIMVVRGKSYDYVGSVIAADCFVDIKSDLDKLECAGQAIRQFEKSVKEGEVDHQLFNLLEGFIGELEGLTLKAKPTLLSGFFSLKLFAALGYEPSLYECVSCQNKILPEGNRVDFSKGGLVCKDCAAGQNLLTVSDGCIKVLRTILKENFATLNKLKANNRLENEIHSVINGFVQQAGS